MTKTLTDGFWWVRGSKRVKVAGTLHHAPGEPFRLRLLGSLRQTPLKGSVDAWLGSPYDLIHGETIDGKLVTLDGCWTTQLRTSHLGRRAEQLHVATAYVGAHLKSTADARFKRLSVRFTFLHDWLSPQRLGPTLGAGHRVMMDYQPPDPIVVPIDGAKVRFVVDLGMRAHHKGVDLRQDSYIVFVANKALSLNDWLRNYVQPFETFLDLATDHPNAIAEVQGFQRGRSRISQAVLFLYQPIYRGSKKKRSLIESDMLFGQRDCDPKLEPMLRSWFRAWKSDDLRTVSQLFLLGHKLDHTFMESRFMAYFAALEAFHRRRLDHPAANSTEHAKRIQGILDACPQASRAWLNQKLEWSNSLSARARLRELAARFEADLSTLGIDWKDFVDRAIKTRNYQAHFDSTSTTGRWTDSVELFHATQTLGWMVKLCLLEACGFVSGQRASFLNRNAQFKWLVSEIQNPNP